MRFPFPVDLPPALRVSLVLSGLALSGLAGGGCEVATPELPSFDTRLALPIGNERLEILDIIDDEEYLVALEDGTLGFSVDGDADTLSLDFDLGADLPGQSLATQLGTFALDVPAPDPFAFVLADLYPPAVPADGMTTIVPAFTFGTTSGGTDLPDVASATVTAGTLTVTVDNGLPVPVSGPGAPTPLRFNLIDPGTGSVLVVVDFPDEIPTGGRAQGQADLAGVVLPAQVAVDLQGGSPGSGAAPVPVDAGATVAVSAAFSALQVDRAEAVVPAQTYADQFTVDLPADYRVLSAVIATGSVPVSMSNDLSIPCQALVTWPEVRDPDGEPLMLVLNLPPGGSATTDVDFAGCTVLAPGAVPLTRLNSTVEVASPGSGGASVVVRSDMGVSVDVGTGRIVFAEVTGEVPAVSFALETLESEIDLPDELEGLALTRASLVLEVTNTSGVEAMADLVLAGINDRGTRVDVDLHEAIVGYGEPTRGVTTIVLDETNSGIVPFLNNLPSRITMDGTVTAGGPGIVGTVRPGDQASIGWRIVAPVEVTVDGARILGDYEELDLDQDTRDLIRDHGGAAEVLMEVGNHLPFDVQARLLFSPDTTTIETAPLLTVGPVTVDAGATDPLTFETVAATTSQPTIALTAAQTRLLATEGLYGVVEVLLPGNGGTARVMTTDYVTFQGLIRLDVHVSDD